MLSSDSNRKEQEDAVDFPPPTLVLLLILFLFSLPLPICRDVSPGEGSTLPPATAASTYRRGSLSNTARGGNGPTPHATQVAAALREQSENNYHSLDLHLHGPLSSCSLSFSFLFPTFISTSRPRCCQTGGLSPRIMWRESMAVRGEGAHA